MSLFKKTVKQVEQPVTQSITYPLDIVYWKDHYEAISDLIKSSDMDLNNLHASESFKGKLVPEPDNEHDPKAVKVFASLRGNNKKWYDIGYISSNDNELIRPDIKKVVAGTHYWTVRIYFDARMGLLISISLRESKFK